MNNYYESDAVKSTPDVTNLKSQGYPTNGSPSLGIPATKPGAAWFYSVTSEIINAIKLGKIEPSVDSQEQLSLSIQAYVAEQMGKLVPSGTVLASASSTIPDGYLLCNGVAVSRTTYANLFDAIGTIYGVGDGETTFNLPDLRDRFVEGVGTNALGTYLEARLPNVMGYFTTRALVTAGVYYKGFYSVTSSATDKYVELNGNTNLVDVHFNANRANSIYSDRVTTVQPKSLNLNYIVKI